MHTETFATDYLHDIAGGKLSIWDMHNIVQKLAANDPSKISQLKASWESIKATAENASKQFDDILAKYIENASSNRVALKSFNQLFPELSSIEIEQRVALLRKPNPLNGKKRVINEENKYLAGKPKGAMMAWTDVMQNESGGGMIKGVSDELMAKLYKEKFKGLDMGLGRSFSNGDNKTTSQYVKHEQFFKNQLKELITQ